MNDPGRTLPAGGAFLIESVTEREPFIYEDFSADELGLAQHRRGVRPQGGDCRISTRSRAKQEGLMPALLKRAGELGLLMVEVPTEYGGLGLHKTVAVLVAASASECASFSTAMTAHTGIGTLPLVFYGNDEQRARYLPKLATGEWLAAYALSEPGAGSDALGVKTRAVLSADGRSYRLNGVKQFITNAGFADLFTVFAKVDGEKFTAFLIERTLPGVSTGPEEHKMGIKGSSTRQVILEDVDVPVENVLGEVGQGHKIAFNILNVGRLKLGVIAAGGARRALQAGGRVRGGSPPVRGADPDVRRAPTQGGGHDGGHLCRGEHELSHRRLVGCGDRTLGSERTDVLATGAARHRGVRHRAIDPQSVRQRGARFRGRRGAADVRRLRVHRRVSAGALLSRFTHQPHLRRHQRDQSPAHSRHLGEAGDELEACRCWSTSKHVRAELAGASSRVPDNGPLAAETAALEAAKSLTAHIAGLLLERQAAELAKKQQHLELLSNMICEVYALDSTIGRTLKLIRQRGVEGAVLEIDLTRVATAHCTEKIYAAARRLVANDATAAELPERLQEIARLSPYVPSGILDTKTRIAERVAAMYAPGDRESRAMRGRLWLALPGLLCSRESSHAEGNPGRGSARNTRCLARRTGGRQQHVHRRRRADQERHRSSRSAR